MKTTKSHGLQFLRRTFPFGRVRRSLMMAALLLVVAPALAQQKTSKPATVQKADTLILNAQKQKESGSTGQKTKGARPPAQKVDSLAISPRALTLKMGESAPLEYTIVPAGAEVEIWSSENPRIAFERDGRVYAGTMEGTTVITAYADRGRKSATCTVTVGKKEEVKYPLCYEVKVNIKVHTVKTSPSDRNPAPKWEEFMQITGTLVGEVVRGRVEKLESDPGYFTYLIRTGGHVPVFIANSDYEVKDDNFNVVFRKRCPLQVNIERTEWEYKDFGRDGGVKYVKTFDYRAAGINDKQTILMGIHPYWAEKWDDPKDETRLFPHYAVALNVETYTEHFAKPIPGNGRILKWDDHVMRLEPAGNEVSVNAMGRKSSREYQEGTKPPAIMALDLNKYFLNPSGGTKVYNLKGWSREEANRRTTRINVRLEFRSIANVKATSTIDPPPPPLEDWDYY